MRRRAQRVTEHHQRCALVLANRGNRRLYAGGKLEPAVAIHKEIELRFVPDYLPLEYGVLLAIADGKTDCLPLTCSLARLDSVRQAFTELGTALCQDPGALKRPSAPHICGIVHVGFNQEAVISGVRGGRFCE
jgi:hypothetical protein